MEKVCKCERDETTYKEGYRIFRRDGKGGEGISMWKLVGFVLVVWFVILVLLFDFVILVLLFGLI